MKKVFDEQKGKKEWKHAAKSCLNEKFPLTNVGCPYTFVFLYEE